ncbi:hypothetical protein [Pseudolactococcus hodotermopsidis]|nr:hypothetical protein [Lactococcus hodotermopsidis]
MKRKIIQRKWALGMALFTLIVAIPKFLKGPNGTGAYASGELFGTFMLPIIFFGLAFVKKKEK